MTWLQTIRDTKQLSDIAGLPIGHAPRVLAGFFWTVLDEDGSVYAVATGELCHSFPPWPAPGVVVEQLSLAPMILHVHQANSNITFPCWALLWKKMAEGSVLWMCHVCSY